MTDYYTSTNFADSLTRQQWAEEIWMDAKDKDPLTRLEGKPMFSVINKRTDLSAGDGQRLEFPFLLDLAGGGLTASDSRSTGLAAFSTATGLAADSSYGADALGTLNELGSTWGDKAIFSADTAGYGKIIGREEPLRVLADYGYIGEKKHGVRSPGSWLDQLGPDYFNKFARIQLQRWFTMYMHLMKIKHLAGVTTWQFPSAPTAPTTNTVYEMNRHVFGGNATAKGEIDEGCYMQTEELDRLRELAVVSIPTILPYTTEAGNEIWVVLLHPYQVTALRKDEKFWQAHAYGSERGPKNPVFTGALANYNGLELIEEKYLPLFSDGGAAGNLNYARALLLGLNAGCFLEGKKPDYKRDETSSEADYGDSPGERLRARFGFKKTQVKYDGTNNVDVGVVALDTYYSAAVGTNHGA